MTVMIVRNHLVHMVACTVSFMLQPDFVTPPRRNAGRSDDGPRVAGSYPEAHRRVWRPSTAAAAS